MKKLLLVTAALCVCTTGANACAELHASNNHKVCYSRVYDKAHLAKHPEQTVSGMRMSILSGTFEFTLDVQFRGDKDKWAFNAVGVCDDLGPGFNCGVMADGCEPWKGGNNFYVTFNKNQTTLYLYPKEIPLEIDSDKQTRIFTKGKDDNVFRLEETACWKIP